MTIKILFDFVVVVRSTVSVSIKLIVFIINNTIYESMWYDLIELFLNFLKSWLKKTQTHSEQKKKIIKWINKT